MMDKLPVWFVSHGAPDIVMCDNATTRAWGALAAALPSPPELVLCISAHWDWPVPALSDGGSEIQYDFGGFSPELHEWNWPLVNAGDVPARLSAQLGESGLGRAGASLPVVSRPLDHGVWVPLSRMWPRPRFPVLQLSLNSARGTRWHLELGQHLAALRDSGVLIIASGGVVHNLRRLDWSDPPGAVPTWAQSFVSAVDDALARGDENALCDPWVLPGGRESHPSLEHYLPLLVACGAARPQTLTAVHRDWSHGSLALHVYAA